MIDLDNQTSLPVDSDALEKIAHFLTPKTIELIITDNKTIQSLNAQYRDKDTPTDVLSFPMDAPFEESWAFPLGSIVISEAFVREKAVVFGHSLQDELSLLFIHGVLHLLGFDHECDAGEMRHKEAELIAFFTLPKSLIVRTEEA